MTVSKAQKVATAKYEAKAYDKVLVRLPRGKKSSGKAEGAERKRFHKRGHRRKATAGQHNRIAKRPGRSAPVSFSPHNFAQSDKKDGASTVYRVAIMCYNVDSRKGVS